MAAQRGDESTISVKRAATAAHDDEIALMHAGSPVLQCTLTVPLWRGSFRFSTKARPNISAAPRVSHQKVSM